MTEAALPEKRYLWIGPGHALYVGPSLGLGPHSGSVSCLAVAIGGLLTVHTENHQAPPAGTALIPPRLVHRITSDAPAMAFLFLDAASTRHRAARAAMTSTTGKIQYGHREEAVLVQGPPNAEEWLDRAAPAGGPPRIDPRVTRAIDLLGQGLSARQIAAEVRLSPSRMLVVFREQTGTSLRRYRLWLRMIDAARLVKEHGDLTTAAAGAGFASPSHFSDAFHAMFGLRPSRLLGTEILTAPDSGPCAR